MDHRPTFLPIQALRAVAALLVVLFHLRIVEARFGRGEPLLPGPVQFADAGVDLFFVISGFVMAIVASGRYRSAPNAGRFLARRAWRVVPPYWIYTSLVVALMLLAPGIANSSYADQSILASYLLWPQQQLPLLTVGWTLVHEMYFYLVMAGAIALLHERHVARFLLAWAVIVIMSHASLGGTRPPWLALVSNPMTLEFIAGAFIGLHWQRLSARAASTCVKVGVGVFLAAAIALDAAEAGALDPTMRTLVFGSAASLIVLGLVAGRKHPESKVAHWLKPFGDSSYSLYLSHVFVISAAGRVWQMTSFNEAWWQHALFLMLAVTASLAAGIASWRWLEQPLLRRGGAIFHHLTPAAIRSV